MKMMLHHVTGGLRGRTQYFDTDRITLGAAETCSVVFDPSKDPVIAPIHADISVEGRMPILRDRSGHSAVLVNGQQTGEAALHDGDQIRFGDQGPLMRFHILPDGSHGGKRWRDIVTDSQDLVLHTPHRRYTSPIYLARTVVTDIVRHGSRTVKVVALIAVLLPVLVIAGLSVTLYRQTVAVGASEERIAELLGELETGRLTHAELKRRADQERLAIEELRAQREELMATLRATVEKEEAARLSEEELEAVRARLEELATSQRYAEELISRFEGGVGLLQGGYQLVDRESQRPLRYMGFDETGRPLVDEHGNLRLTLEGDTLPLVIYYAGTGFLVDARGTILTNRHLVRMWETYPPVQAALKAGYEPKMSVLRVYFPQISEPFAVEILHVSNKVDLAVLRTARPPRRIPILPLAVSQPAVKPGEPVLILSYPGTFDSLLSRLPPAVGGDVLRAAGSDPLQLARELAKRDLIRPLSTQGHIADVSDEVMTYEARSAGGSSGGPVLNRAGQVVAVNHSVLTRVAGLNLGVTMTHVHAELAEVRRKK